MDRSSVACLGVTRDAHRRSRLPRGGRRRHGHGVHRRADRPRRRTRGPRRPPPRRRRALARGLPVRPPAPGVGLLRRRVDAARRRPSAAARARGGPAGAGHQSPRSAPTTTTCWPTGCWSRAGSSSSPAASTSATARSSRASRASGSRCPSGAGSSTPATSPPTSRRRRRRRSASPTACAVIPVNDLARLDEAPSQYVVVGSGKTATDACIWLLARGVDPDAICWVRPRDPWMLNRAVVQPDPAVYLGMVADMMAGGGGGGVAGRPVPPAGGRRHHAAHRPLGHADDGQGAHPGHVGARAAAQHRERRTPRAHPVGAAAAGSPSTEGSVAVARDALVVHCAADGLKNPPLVPDLGTRRRSRCSRSGPGSRASARHSPATSRRPATTTRRRTGCARRRRSATRLADWATMNVLGTRAATSFGAEPDIKAWADRVALNPARIPPGARRIAGAGRRARPSAGAHGSRAGPARRAQWRGALTSSAVPAASTSADTSAVVAGGSGGSPYVAA